jgi:glutathione S-transferase
MTGPDFFAALFSSNSAMTGQKSTSGSEKRVQEKQGKPEHLTIWGRANSVNVQKVLWCLAELDLAYQRIDAGMAFRTTGPNGRVPTLVDGDYVLWESNSIMRYLNLAYGGGSPIYPPSPQARAAVDRWLDWTLSTLQPVDRPVFWALVRTPVEKRDMVAIQKDVDAEAMVWRIPEALLASRRFIEGDQFTIADIAIGAFARRWFGVEGVAKPKLPNLERWFAQISQRPGFAKFIAPPMS